MKIILQIESSQVQWKLNWMPISALEGKHQGRSCADPDSLSYKTAANKQSLEDLM